MTQTLFGFPPPNSFHLNFYLRRGEGTLLKKHFSTSFSETALCGIIDFQKILMNVLPKNVSMTKYVWKVLITSMLFLRDTVFLSDTVSRNMETFLTLFLTFLTCRHCILFTQQSFSLFFLLREPWFYLGSNSVAGNIGLSQPPAPVMSLGLNLWLSLGQKDGGWILWRLLGKIFLPQ